MKKKNTFLTALLATTLVVGGSALVGCSLVYTPNSDTTTTTYKVAIVEANGVDATLSVDEAEAGTKVEITINSVPEGYEVSTISADVSGVNVTAESDTLFSFYMPESDVNLTIYTSVIVEESYTLTIVDNIGAGIGFVLADDVEVEAIDEGNAAGNLYTIVTGATVYVVLGVEYENEIIRYSGTCSLDLNGSDITSNYDSDYALITFTMPSQDSVLTISQSEAHSINVQFDDETRVEEYIVYNLDEEETATSALSNTNMYLTITMKDGYEVDTVTSNDVEDLSVGTGGWTFTMPNNDVEIYVTTKEATSSGDAATKVTITLDDYSTATFYTSEVLESDDINPNSYSMTASQVGNSTYEAGDVLAFEASVLALYNSTYEIDSVKINGFDVTDSAREYTYYYEAYETQTSRQLELYSFTIEEGTNTVEITAKEIEAQPEIPEEETAHSLTIANTGSTPADLTTYIQVGSEDEQQATSLSDVEEGETVVVSFWSSDITSYKIASVTINSGNDSYTTLVDSGSLPSVTFTMPTTDTTVEVVWEETYSVTYQPSENEPDDAKVTIYKYDDGLKEVDEFSEGDRVCIRVSSSTSFNAIYYNQNVAETYNSGIWYEFTMPAEDVIVTVDWDNDTSSEDPTGETYSITIDKTDSPNDLDVEIYDSNMANTITSAAEGDLVYLNVWSQSGLPSAVYYNGNECEHVDGYWYSFTMPGEAVTITFSWEATAHSITVDYTGAPSGFEVNLFDSLIYMNTLTEAEEGEDVYIELYSSSGTYPSAVYYKTDTTIQECTLYLDNGQWGYYYYFQMPDEDVTITFDWDDLDSSTPASYSLSYDLTGAPNNTEITFLDSSLEGARYDLTATVGEVVYFHLYYESNEVEPVEVYYNESTCEYYGEGYYYFTMPSEDVTITIQWGAISV